jgi:hypothetical protein
MHGTNKMPYFFFNTRHEQVLTVLCEATLD